MTVSLEYHVSKNTNKNFSTGKQSRCPKLRSYEEKGKRVTLPVGSTKFRAVYMRKMFTPLLAPTALALLP